LRDIDVSCIREALRKLALEANTNLPSALLDALEKARGRERSPRGQEILDEILSNGRLAAQHKLPACQDTGLAVVFMQIGQDVHLTGGDLGQTVNAGIAQGYREGFLRMSVVCDPLRRTNSGDNTPAVLHVEIIPGDRLRLTLLPKGGGAENMSALRMLTPAEGWEGTKRFVLDCIVSGAANACPPLVLGVGIGGDFESCPLLAKRALLRPLGQPHPDPQVAIYEQELLDAVNATGIGPMGLGGSTTALAVHIETSPCHIASLPVALNLNCHSHRARSVEL
jgi:fumarate hydratase subunit alpha